MGNNTSRLVPQAPAEVSDQAGPQHRRGELFGVEGRVLRATDIRHRDQQHRPPAVGIIEPISEHTCDAPIALARSRTVKVQRCKGVDRLHEALSIFGSRHSIWARLLES